MRNLFKKQNDPKLSEWNTASF